MIEETPQVELIFSDEFKSRLRALNKRYRNIRSDLQLLLDEIQSGDFPGDRVPNTGSTVFKARQKTATLKKEKAVATESSINSEMKPAFYSL